MKLVLWILLLVAVIPAYNPETAAQRFTANHYKNPVDSAIKAIDPGAKLMSIKSDSAFVDGSSISWQYIYTSLSGDIYVRHFLHTAPSSVIYDSISTLQLVGSTAVTLPWIDSDSGLVLAENQGGLSFRNSHPRNKIRVDLGEPKIGRAHV